MRLIDADETYKVLTDYYHQRTEIQHEALKKALSKVLTVDAVEVVRCKDCRWYENDGYHTNCQIMRFCVEAEDYCSRGERREDGKVD